ncbi:TPA: restriction endonuclease subunit S [Vibrio parahaemolyticus]|uniref:restriction endonuclease subunit S n=1 Tax=Vibrio parahaemolyticus TaxID=670 RepID=UPI001123F8A9|nr:restriction endonuclease subunit S [Vibrio parahaemolyticus]TOE76935.1 hypothetical protein CGJ36_10005 [Vibrio parahaemolyticus]HCG6610706.1 restriction endonuclease subunit S [Vibrio parahaemolyticus]HCG6613282.1 restriction endonuclease subunit S [Vibrio parahaemolyticus]HCG7077179.1 restriction endonuclease subunit S [Vibrio parahaemolyticus]HCG7079236.1 restriction endonuclease subunit S [Vibrio parahaemolyticus]
MQDLIEKAAEGLKLDRSDWKLVKFGDVAIQQKKTVDRDNTELTRYVKGEHMYSEDIHLREWGELKDEYLGPAFIRKFEEGDILYGSRRTYLRKVVVAPFEGITSNTTFVIRANDKLIDKRLLPYLMLSEGFSQHSILNSKGSVNPYVNWKDLASYEFLLPPLEKQNEILQLLELCSSALESSKQLLERCQKLVLAYRAEIFAVGKWKKARLNDFFEVQLGKMLSAKSKLGLSPCKYLTNQNIQWGRIVTTDLNEMDFDEKEKAKFELKSGDLLVCEGGDVGRTAIWRGELENCYYQKALHRLRSIDGKILPEIMLQFMQWSSFCGTFRALTGHTTIAHLTAIELKELKVPEIPREVQEYWKNKFEQAIDTESKLSAQLDHLKKLKMSLINQVF